MVCARPLESLLIGRPVGSFPFDRPRWILIGRRRPTLSSVLATSVFSVWRFPTEVGAQRAVHPLAWAGGDERGVRIEDAAVVSWPGERVRPLAWQVSDLAGERPFAGAFWGMLVGLLFLLPLSERTETPHAGADAGAAGWSEAGLVRLGFDAAFARAVRAQVGPGSSALFVFAASPNPQSLTKAMPPSAREVARLIMTTEQLAGLHAGFDG